MPDDTKDLDVRLSVSEVKIQKIEEDMAEHKTMLKDISVEIKTVSDHFSKLNGSLPHIQETCTNIERNVQTVIENDHRQDNKITKNSLYIKIMWGVFTLISSGVIGWVVKTVFFAD